MFSTSTVPGDQAAEQQAGDRQRRRQRVRQRVPKVHDAAPAGACRARSGCSPGRGRAGPPRGRSARATAIGASASAATGRTYEETPARPATGKTRNVTAKRQTRPTASRNDGIGGDGAGRRGEPELDPAAPAVARERRHQHAERHGDEHRDEERDARRAGASPAPRSRMTSGRSRRSSATSRSRRGGRRGRSRTYCVSSGSSRPSASFRCCDEGSPAPSARAPRRTGSPGHEVDHEERRRQQQRERDERASPSDGGRRRTVAWPARHLRRPASGARPSPHFVSRRLVGTRAGWGRGRTSGPSRRTPSVKTLIGATSPALKSARSPSSQYLQPAAPTRLIARATDALVAGVLDAGEVRAVRRRRAGEEAGQLRRVRHADADERRCPSRPCRRSCPERRRGLPVERDLDAGGGELLLRELVRRAERRIPRRSGRGA